MKWINNDGRDVTAQTLDSLKKVMGGGDLAKAATVTLSNNLVAYDLEAPAKNLYPVLTPIRNRIPRTTKNSGAGTGPNWKEVSAITPGGIKSMPWVPEGQRAPRLALTTAPRSASYVTLGLETDVTFEAQSAANGFEDEMAASGMRLLSATMILEEQAILGGNRNVLLGKPSAPSVTPGTDGTIADGTYNVYVVALTMEGYLAASVSGGVLQATTVTGLDAQTYTLNGGSSQISNATSSGALSTGNVNSISASTPAIKGAVAYAWYVGTAAAEKLEAITLINSVKLTALAGTGAALSGLVTTTDYSRNSSLAFDGLLYSAFNSAAAYYKALPTGTAGTGTPLTASGHGSISEIDAMLQDRWDNYRLSFDELYVSAQELMNINAKVLQGASAAPLVRFNLDVNQQAPTLVAGQIIGYYFNPFTVNGGQIIPIRLHPNLPQGTLLGWCQNLPAQYQSANVPNVAEIQCRRDYYQIPWPLITRANQTGVYAEEVLKCYAPFGLGVITNIGNG